MIGALIGATGVIAAGYAAAGLLQLIWRRQEKRDGLR